MEKLYSTGEFAKIAGVTLRTIRYYDKIGLLKQQSKSNLCFYSTKRKKGTGL